MSRSAYGSAARAKKNQKRKSHSHAHVMRDMPDMVSAHMPALSEIPVDVEKYNEQVKRFQSFLRTRYADITSLRFAFMALAKHIAKGNEEGLWQLDIPATIVSVPRTTSSRNLKRFKAGIIAANLCQSWQQVLASEKGSRNGQAALADVLISAIVFGGLANPRAVTSLANVLINEPKPLTLARSESSTCLWIDLLLEGGQDPLNQRVSDESGAGWQSLHRFYPDNRTLGQLLRFQASGSNKFTETSGPLHQLDVWKIIEGRLTNGAHRQTLSSLNAFCQGAQSVTEALPDVELPQALLECAAGRVGSVSLPSKHHQNRFARNLDSKIPQAFSLNDVLISPGKSGGQDTKKHVALTRSEYAGDTITPDIFIRQMHAALKAEISGLKNTPAQAIRRLQEISRQNLSLNAAILVDWLLDRLVPRKIKVSSALRYFTEIARLWLFHTNEADLDDMDESELEHVYREMLSFKPEDKIQSQNYLQGRLQDLHEFASQSDRYALPALSSFFEGVGTTQAQSQVRAGYIPEHNFQSMLQSIQNLTGTDPDTKEGFAVLLILAYRTGMRRGELLKLRLSDIERSEERWIYVVNNRYGSNKSDSARRRIPLYLLLLPSEMQRFQQYFKKRLIQNENHTSTLLFSDPHAVTVPHSGSLVSGLIKALLGFQGLGELSFHHLRHSTLTNLFVVMEESPDLIVTLTGYSLEHAKKIRSDLFSANPMCSRDKYSAIAGVAGHLSPETTFLYYIHEVSLHVWERLRKYDPELDIEQLAPLSGLSAQTLNAYSKEKGSRARLSDLRHEILNRLSPMCLSIKAGDASAGDTAEWQQAPSKSKPTVLDCYSVLRALEDGDPVSTLCIRYSIEEKKINGWLDSATKIQDLKTKSGNRRHFPKAVSPTAIGFPLAPIRPQDKATAKEIDGVISSLQDAFREDSEGVRWCIDYWKNNTSQTKPGTRFTQTEDVIKFVKLIEKVIPRSRWELSILHAPKVVDEELNVWRSLGISYKVKDASQGKSIQAYLRLRHINEQVIVGKRKKNIKQFSSQLLNYIFHMVAIMIDGADFERLEGTVKKIG